MTLDDVRLLLGHGYQHLESSDVSPKAVAIVNRQSVERNSGTSTEIRARLPESMGVPELRKSRNYGITAASFLSTFGLRWYGPIPAGSGS